jgi:hypothetical protein
VSVGQISPDHLMRGVLRWAEGTSGSGRSERAVFSVSAVLIGRTLSALFWSSGIWRDERVEGDRRPLMINGYSLPREESATGVGPLQYRQRQKLGQHGMSWVSGVEAFGFS